MIKNYLKVFFRSTIKNPVYSTINILGLAIGLACAIVAFLFINNEINYNKGFDDYNKIYRIGTGLKNEMSDEKMPTALPGIAPSLAAEIPEIEAATRLVTWFRSSLIKSNNEFYPNVDCYIADSALLNVFSFKILQGDPNSFLKSPSKIAITESLAKKIFKDKDPLSQFIEFEGQKLEVAWIMEDVEKSMIDFDLLANYDFNQVFKESVNLDAFTFFKLRNIMTDGVKLKIQSVSNRVTSESFGDWADEVTSPIQPLSELYLKSNLRWEIGKTGSIRTIYIYGFLALIILLIAVINYINLLTSRSEYRNKEVGIRKVVGANKSKLRLQYLSESVITSVVALLIGFVITEFFIFLVNKNLNLDLKLFDTNNTIVFILCIIVTISIGLISGIYPAFVLSSYNPIKVIKGVSEKSSNSNFLKVLLVIIQFSISTLLIISIFIFNSQIHFLKNKDLGFDKNNLMILTGCTEKLQQNFESIRHDLLAYHQIKDVSASQSYPGKGRSGQSIRKLSDNLNERIAIAENRVQDFYTETVGIEIIKGRTFNPEFNDDRSILINETAANMLNLSDPIGVEVMTNREFVIIGVMKDYHFYATTKELKPLYLSNYANQVRNIEIRINPNDKSATIKYVKDIIQKYDPDYYWDHFFIDDMLRNQYKVEDSLFTMIFWGSGIALILSILGLFALTSYTVSKKFKEIGIRKTFGASVNSIVNKLNRDIIRWVLFTNIIAWPVAYIVMKNWLQNYPYKVDIYWGYFVLVSFISLVIAILTISFQAVKAARMNPVDAIRYE
ncbi:MAG: FtsX-like permease family protein [Bacteroidales bacterium]|nr:FtsX-like permease family protein [Bacteroidales bacterium]